jgi:mannosyltransferase
MSQRVRGTLLIFILLCAFALRLYRLDFQDIWWDEGRNIDVSSRSLAVIATAKEMDIHPPLYFYTLHLWMLGAGRSEFAVRFLSVFFSLLTIPLFYRFSVATGTNPNQTLNHLFGLLAATVAAFAPFYVSEAQETRMYTMAIFLTTASAYFLYRAWREGGGLLWAGYVLTSALSIYTHYSAGFILIAENAFLGLMLLVTAYRQGEWSRILRGWVLSQLGIALLYLPQMRIALRQYVAYENPTMGVPDLPSFLLQVWRGFSLGPADELIQAPPFLAGIAFILVLGLIIGLTSLNSQISILNSQLIWLCLWLVLPILLYFYVLRDRPFFHPRYIMLATPPYYLLLAYALGQIWKRVPAVGLLSVVFLLTAFVPAIQADYFDPTGFSEDTRGLVRFIEKQARENDVVLIDVPYPFDYYYHGRAPAHYLFVDIHTVAQRLTELCQGKERVFWIRWHKSDTDPRGAVLFLLDKYGQPLGQTGFRGYDVLWYQLPPHGTFSLTSEINPIDVDFADQISLMGYAYGGRGAGATSSEAEVEAGVVPAGKKMWAVLQWQLQQKVERDYKVALLLKDSGGHLIGQDDRQLINDRHLYTTSWWLDEVVTNVYDPLVPDGTPPGQYTVEVAVYEPESLARLDVLDANGAPQATTVQLGTIKVSRPLSPPPVASLGIQHELTADWGEVNLLGYDLADEAIAPGAALSLNLYWQASVNVQGDYIVLIRASDQDGQVWGQVKERPVAGTYPTPLWQEGEVLRDHYELSLPAETPAGQYQLTVGLVDAATESPVGEIALPSLTVAGRSRAFQVPPIQHRLSANLGDQVELLGYDLTPDELRAGEAMHLTLYWRALDEMEVSYTVFVHLLDGENRIWGQRDSVPDNGTLPTTGWVKGEVIADKYKFTVKPDAPPGEYLIEVGMYDAQNNRRLPVLGSQEPEDRILLNQIVVVK